MPAATTVDGHFEILKCVFPELEFNDDASQFKYRLPVEITPQKPLKFALFDYKTGSKKMGFESAHVDGAVLEFNIPMTGDESFSLTSPFLNDYAMELIRRKALKIIDDAMNDGDDPTSIALVVCDYVGVEAPLELESQLLYDYVLETTDPALFTQWRIMCKSARLRHFNKSYFSCSICLDSGFGEDGVLLDCDHSACKSCLVEYTTKVLSSGDVTTIQCPNCPITKTPKVAEMSREEYKEYLFAEKISLHTLKQFLPEEQVQRYERLRDKILFLRYSRRFPGYSAECPKCDKWSFRESLNEDKVYCQGCHYRFCYQCRKQWHGLFLGCDLKPRPIPEESITKWVDEELSDEEKQALLNVWGKERINFAIKLEVNERERIKSETNKASEEALKMPTSRKGPQKFPKLMSESTEKKQCRDTFTSMVPCPGSGCGAIYVKTEGCNHMICDLCFTDFCYLCGRAMQSDHYSNKKSLCYAKCFAMPP